MTETSAAAGMWPAKTHTPPRPLPEEPMNPHPTSLSSDSASRPSFRVICAWCDQSIDHEPPASGLSADSHGICPPCARRHFGVILESVFVEHAA